MVLILRASNTYEFTGVVRLAQQDVADIALAKGGKKENRGATRYKLKSSARIDRIFCLHRFAKLACACRGNHHQYQRHRPLF